MQSSAHTRSRLPDKSTFTSPQSSSSPANTKAPPIPSAKDAPSSSHLPPHLPIATPLTLNSSTPLALSKIEWPKDACVKWKVLGLKEDLEMAEKEKEDLMETARQKIVREWKEGILDGLVAYMRRDPNIGQPELWIFEVGDAREGGAISQYSVPGLTGKSDGHFHPSWLYPCPGCITKPHPCQKCDINPDATPTASMLLPRENFRRPLWLYLSSLRDKLLDRLARLRDGCRLGDGLVYASTDRAPRELDDGWQQDDASLYLIHAQIQLSLQSRCLFIHPSVRASALINFPIDKYTRPPPLTAVTLLPYGHPAYYLSSSQTTIPTTTLDPYLQGLGTSAWRSDERDAGWVECWILTPPSVANAESGVSILWPAYLVAQDVSKKPLNLQLLPDSIQMALSEQAFTSTSFNPRCALATYLIRCSVDGPAYGFSVNITATETIAADKSFSVKLSPEKMNADVRLVLADSVASYEFTRSAVAARDAARTSKANTEREQERKDRDMDRAEQDDQSFKYSPAQSLSVARLRWTRALDESSIEEEEEESVEFSGLEVSVSEDLDPYYDDTTMDEAETLPTGDYGVVYDMTGIADDPAAFMSNPTTDRSDRSPEDTNMGSPTSVQSVSSMSSVAQHRVLKPTRPKLKAPGKSIEPLTPDGLDDEPIHEEGKAVPPDPPTVVAPSPPWDASEVAANNPASLAIPLLFSQTASLIQTPGVPLSRAPRSEASGDDGMDGLGLTDDDFAFYDAPSRDEDILLDDTTNEDDTAIIHAGPQGLLSPPAEPIQLDDFDEQDRETVMLPAIEEEEHAPVDNSTLTPAAAQEDCRSPFEAPVSPSDGDRTPVAPLSPVFVAQAGGFIDPFEPLMDGDWKDSKYTVGKFALDKVEFPPVCDDMPGDSCFFTWDTLSKTLIDPYSNPHVGLVRRWQGMKRSRASAFGEDHAMDSATKRMRCSWIDVEEVKKVAEQRKLQEPGMDEASDSTLDDETLVVIDEDEDGSLVSEEPIPWPTQLLWTVTVVLGSFNIHGFTPPLSLPPTSLRRAPSPTPLAALTPVSPAAFIQLQDNLKKQEDAINVKCVQVLENPVLAEWVLQARTTRSEDIRWTTAFNLGKLKKAVDIAMPSPKLLTLGDALDKQDLPPVDRMVGSKSKTDAAFAIFGRDFPIAAGLDGAVVNICWPALRFWEKLALYPVGGQKDVLAFAFYDKSVPSRESRDIVVKSWLEAMGQAYTQMGYGEHRSGHSDELDIRQGILSGQLEDLESQLGAMLVGIPAGSPHLVVYVFCPASQLQTLGNTLAATFDSLSSSRMVVHLIPESCLLYASHACHSRPSPLDVTALAVYNRLLRKVKRTTLRKVYAAQPDEKRALQFPAVTIARTPAPKVEFSLEWPPKNTDVMDPVAWLHVAYTITPDWLLSTCIDQLGEAHSQRVWSTKQGEKTFTIEALVAKIWAFTWKFARRARKEWRIVVARWGLCPVAEIEAWQSLVTLCSALPLTVSFSLVCIDSRPWQETLPNKEDWRRPPNPTASSEGHAHIVDATGTSYGICLAERFEIAPWNMATQQDCPISPMVNHLELLDNSEPPRDWLRPLYTALLMQAPSDGSFTPSYSLDHPANTMTTTSVHLLYYASSDSNHAFGSRSKFMLDLLRNYQELALLSREKWGRPIGSGVLPWHLAAVILMERVLTIH